MRKSKEYLFKHKQQFNRARTLNEKHQGLSAEELLVKYYTEHPRPIKQGLERVNRMFRRFD